MIYNKGLLTRGRFIEWSTHKATEEGCNLNTDAKLEVLQSHKEKINMRWRPRIINTVSLNVSNFKAVVMASLVTIIIMIHLQLP